MSNTRNYHQPDALDSPGEESDSDADIDLQELDPAPARKSEAASRGTLREDEQPVRVIPLRTLRKGRTRRPKSYSRSLEDNGQGIEGDEDLRGLLQDANSRDSPDTAEDNAPLLRHDPGLGGKESGDPIAKASRLTKLRLPSLFNAGRIEPRIEDSREPHGSGDWRNISIGQYPPPRFPPNAVSNAKYTPWSFLPRTLYNEFSFFFNMYFLLVALSQVIPPLRIGYLSTYVAPLAFVLTITLGKEALDDIARRKRDNEANKEGYTVLRLRNPSQTSARGLKGRNVVPPKPVRRSSALTQATRLDAIAEEEDSIGDMDYDRTVEMDELMIRSRDLKVGDVVRLGKDQRVPADLVILKSYTNEFAVAAPSRTPSSSVRAVNVHNNIIRDDPDHALREDLKAELTSNQSGITPTSTSSDNAGIGETFLRTDQLDGETDWKLRLASPLTQSLDPRSFTRLKIVAGKPDKKVNEFIGTVEYSPRVSNIRFGQACPNPERSIKTAPLTIDNTAWANTVLASSATVLAVVIYTGAQTRQALSTSPSRSKTGLLEHEINNLTKILCALTLTLSVVLVALEGFEDHENQKWYVAVTRFLILFSTIIPISLRVNLDMGKTVYAWFVERDQDIPDTVVRTSTIPEELGRIEYLLSDKTGTLTQNGKSSLSPII